MAFLFKLMERNIPMNLTLLEHWFAIGVTCVKWGSIMSRFIGLIWACTDLPVDILNLIHKWAAAMRFLATNTKALFEKYLSQCSLLF